MHSKTDASGDNDEVLFTPVVDNRNYDPTKKPKELDIHKAERDLSIMNNAQVTWDNFTKIQQFME